MVSDRVGLYRATLIAPAMMLASGVILLYAARSGEPAGASRPAG